MKMKTLPIVLTTIALVACSTPSTVAPVSVPLQYKMMAAAAEFPAQQSCAAVSSVRVVDAREDKTLGKRFIEGKNAAPAAAVTTTSDVAEWVKTGADAALARAGVANGRGPELELRVEQITTSENVLHRSGYEGRITLAAEVRSGGAACWKGRVEGYAENYGYAGSTENYQETLNHALDRAMIRLLGTSEVKNALCSCGR